MNDSSAAGRERKRELARLRARIAELEKAQSRSRQMEERLRDSEERFRSIFDNSLDAIMLAKPAGKIVAANRAARVLLGMTEEEIRRVGRAGMVIQDEALAEAVEAVEKNGQWRGMLTCRRKDGSTFPAETSAKTFGRADGRTMRVLIFRDMTEQKRAEDSLRESEERFRLFMDNSPTIAWIKDEEGRYVYLSRRCEDSFGSWLKDWMGKTDAEIWPPNIAEQFRQSDLAVREADRPTEVMEQTVSPDGGRHFWLGCKFPFRASGKPYVAGIGLDITAQKMMEAELARHREHLETLVEERTRELEEKTRILEELNAATRVLLRQREEDRKEIGERFMANMKNLILPYVEKLKGTRLDERQKSYLSIMETHLDEVLSPLMRTMRYHGLTPTESRVASLIRDGRTTKEIAAVMDVTTSSVDSHRKSIRKKLGLSNEKVNLQSHLRSIDI